MRNNINESVFIEALIDEQSINLDTSFYQARLLRGVKLRKCATTGVITGYNVTRGADEYDPLTTEEAFNLNLWGWRKGTCLIARKHYTQVLDRLIFESKGHRLTKLIQYNKRVILKQLEHIQNELEK